MMKEGTLTLSKWGNSLSVRIPKDILDSLNLTDNDKLSYEVKNNQIVLKPQKKESKLKQLFDGFEMDTYCANSPENKEDGLGAPVGKEEL